MPGPSPRYYQILPPQFDSYNRPGTPILIIRKLTEDPPEVAVKLVDSMRRFHAEDDPINEIAAEIRHISLQHMPKRVQSCGPLMSSNCPS
ncbi:hypothetical protein ACVSQB_24380 [Bradyrhizobium elkanii]